MLGDMDKHPVGSRTERLHVSARMARRLPLLAQNLDLDADAIGRRCRLSAQVLDDPQGRVPLQTILAYLEELGTLAPGKSLGLELSRAALPSAYHTPALVLLASNTLRAGLARSFRYQRLWGDGERFTLDEPRNVGHDGPGLAVRFCIPTVRRPGHAILEVCALAETLLAARALTGRTSEAALALGLPTSLDKVDDLRDFFGITPQLETAGAFLVLAEELVDAPLLHANAHFLAIFERQASEELARLPKEDDLSAQVRSQISRGLVRGAFTLVDCADALALSPRTLERRLQKLGLPYQSLVEAVRRKLALQLLADSHSLQEVALLLGYAEPSSFHRACSRWFGKSPTVLRAELRS